MFKELQLKGKYSELADKFREKANENMFLLAKYSDANGKDLWGCICSAMDWIDVGVQYIENFQPPDRHGLQSCMEIFSFVMAIDFTYEAIKSLFWVLQKNGKDSKRGHTPFHQNKGCFSAARNRSITDDHFFKEIRSCCGAHPTNLNTFIADNQSDERQRRYASWTFFESVSSFNIMLYPESITGQTITVEIPYSELIEYFEQRFDYLNILIERIDELYKAFVKEKAKEIIPKSDNPLEQLAFLKVANEQRLKNEYYNEIINQLACFFNTDFEDEENSDIIKNYRSSLLLGIEELYNNIQSLDYKDLIIDKFLNPQTIDAGYFRYEFAALSGRVLSGIYKPFDFKILAEPLKEVVSLHNVHTEEEFYWLIVIALNRIAENYR